MKSVPRIKGVVRRVDNRAGVVLISVGKKSGVAEKMFFEVIRPSTRKYIGRLRVTDVFDDESVCTIVLVMTRGDIEEGDTVTTVLD